MNPENEDTNRVGGTRDSRLHKVPTSDAGHYGWFSEDEIKHIQAYELPPEISLENKLLNAYTLLKELVNNVPYESAQFNRWELNDALNLLLQNSYTLSPYNKEIV